MLRSGVSRHISVECFGEPKARPGSSQPALEVLAVIAYYQPVTRAYVDQVRGVDSAYTVGLLLERELIEECGRLAVPGRPILYRTTKQFPALLWSDQPG